LLRRLAAELGRRGSTAPVRALHVVRSAQPGDVPAARLLLDCAQQVGPRAPGVAVEYLTAARSLLGPTEPDLVATIEVETARQLIATGDLAAAEEILRAPAPAAERARHALVRARLSRLLGRYAEAVATLQAELAGTSDPRQVVLLALEGAMCAAFGGSAAVTEFVALAQRAVGAVTDPAYRAAVQVARAFLTSMTGGPVPTDLPAAAATLDALSDGHLVQLLDPFGMLGWTELELERDAVALRHFERAIAIADRAGHADLLPYLLVGRSYASSRLGAFDTALDAARDAVDAARRLGGASVVLAVAFQASARVYVSGPAEAATVVRDALARPLGTERDWFAEIAARVAARISATAGDTGVDPNTLLRACGGETMAWVEVCNRPYWCTVLSEMFLDRGDRERARHWLGEAARHAEPLGLRGADAHVATARARLLAEVDLAAAVDAAEEAVAGFGALGWTPDEMYARLLTATLSARAGRWSAVTDQLARAHRLATSMPAPWLHRMVAGAQRQLQSAAGRQPAPGGRGELTRRERQIAELVAAGATNADIAAALHVTVKTVEAHLSRAYRKLGVRSRAMLVDAIRSAPSPRNAPSP
ncbi:helix-turn-helix transcriptional regulator, partial [Actinocatenispora thailandica]|uniref:helix-turn-helix transcriptional regulator n=1 Tax=Actinocatenispora thailandica TaxID=227318 RepID=UPI0031D29C49